MLVYLLVPLWVLEAPWGSGVSPHGREVAPAARLLPEGCPQEAFQPGMKPASSHRKLTSGQRQGVRARDGLQSQADLTLEAP